MNDAKDDNTDWQRQDKNPAKTWDRTKDMHLALQLIHLLLTVHGSLSKFKSISEVLQMTQELDWNPKTIP